MRKLFLIIAAVVLCAGCAPVKSQVPEQIITILWAKWAPADQLQKLSEDFTSETGIKVVVKQAPWDRFYDEFFQSVKEKTGQYDMVGGDSQWLGRGRVDGIYVDITKWMKANRVDEQMTAASITGYSEYPAGSKRYWAVPLMGDAMGFAYRKDLFESPVEKDNFRAKYGYELAIPQTWEQLRDIAEFFYRPDQGFYGANIWASPNYDAVTMGMESLVWAYGGSLGDYRTYRVKGILNTPESARGLAMYKAIHQFGAPEWKSAYLDANDAFVAGKVAMVMSYFAFFPDLNDPTKNTYAPVTGFFANPTGPKARVSSLGGQGLSILSVTKKKEYCFKFLEWFVRPEVQRKWAKLGGYSCDRAVLNSKEFLTATPYNAALTESMIMMRDFWGVPEYLELLEVSQKYWHKYLFSNESTAEDVNNAIAREWENIFEMAGYFKE